MEVSSCVASEDDHLVVGLVSQIVKIPSCFKSCQRVDMNDCRAAVDSILAFFRIRDTGR